MPVMNALLFPVGICRSRMRQSCASEEYIAIRDWHMPVTNMEENEAIPSWHVPVKNKPEVRCRSKCLSNQSSYFSTAFPAVFALCLFVPLFLEGLSFIASSVLSARLARNPQSCSAESWQ